MGLVTSGRSDWLATALVELNAYARQGYPSGGTGTVERVTGLPAGILERWTRERSAHFGLRGHW